MRKFCCIIILCVQYMCISNGWNLWLPRLRTTCYRSRATVHDGLTRLHAKPKLSKLISDDLLAALDSEFGLEGKDSGKESHNSKGGTTVATKEKKQKKGKQADNGTNNVLKSAVDDDFVAEDIAVTPQSAAIIAAVPPERFPEPRPEKIRKEKPSSRIRITESAQPEFVSIGLEKVGLTIGAETILKDATFSVSSAERVGLVGPNGGGKSTVLRILTGEVEPTCGTITRSSTDLRLAHLKQEFAESIDPTRTLQEELLTAFREEHRILQEMAQCEAELSETVDDPDRMDAVLTKLQRLQDQADAKGCYALEPRVQKVMDSMGFAPEDGRALVGSFSGGWKMRIGLAKILLLDPNILLLDEPTNHMDLDSVIWLEDFLRRQSLPMLVVSHDREFLDRVCNKIVDVEEGVTVSYSGNYSKYLEQRKARLLQWRERYEKQQRYIREEEAYIRKAHGDPNLAQVAKSREAALEKLKGSDELILPPPRDKKFRFRFPPAPRCGENMIEGSGLGHGYGEGKYQVLFNDVDLQVSRGDRIGFIGPNGSGKSTMMRILMKHEEPQRGFCDYGSSNVQANYYAQNQADALDLDLTVIETLQRNCPLDVSPTDIRTLLGQFMFKGDDVYKQVRVLSGGEKARLALCKMMLQPANLLLLDEPTNHLDITAKEVLEEALQHYGGAVLLISHDRYFMSQVANTIYAFHDKTVERFDCDYHDYMERQAEALAQAQHEEEEEGEARDAGVEGQGAGEDGTVRAWVTEESATEIYPVSKDTASPRSAARPTSSTGSRSTRSLKDKVTSRYVAGDKYRITHAKEVLADPTDSGKKDKKKNFGGSGVTCGNLYKGIKNAKRFMNNG